MCTLCKQTLVLYIYTIVYRTPVKPAWGTRSVVVIFILVYCVSSWGLIRRRNPHPPIYYRFLAIYTIANVTNGQRDRQTDGQTDRLNFYNSTWRSHIALRSHKTRTFNVISALFWGSCPALSWDLWLSGGTKKSSSPAFQRTGSRVRPGRYPQLPRLWSSMLKLCGL